MSYLLFIGMMYSQVSGKERKKKSHTVQERGMTHTPPMAHTCTKLKSEDHHSLDLSFYATQLNFLKWVLWVPHFKMITLQSLRKNEKKKHLSDCKLLSILFFQHCSPNFLVLLVEIYPPFNKDMKWNFYKEYTMKHYHPHYISAWKYSHFLLCAPVSPFSYHHL